MRLSLTKALAGLAALAAFATPASAHPHVWVTSKAEVVYDKDQIAAIQHHWTFDEFYAAMAIQGLDTNNDGVYTREELAELAKVNLEGLKEFDFFTYAKLAGKALEFAAPAEQWLEHKDGVLTLHYKLPLKQPLEASAKGFQFAVYDPSFFIAFEMAKGDAITLAGAPAGCKITVGQLEETPEEKTLTGAMTQQFGGSGSGSTKAAQVTCTNS
ncbi:MAG: DUF1007 family protein [Hyphomicrobiaceae bacterium]